MVHRCCKSRHSSGRGHHPAAPTVFSPSPTPYPAIPSQNPSPPRLLAPRFTSSSSPPPHTPTPEPAHRIRPAAADVLRFRQRWSAAGRLAGKPHRDPLYVGTGQEEPGCALAIFRKK
ncbi:hypothetical protein ABZP36_035714 [Zizania latifolia]